MSNRSWRCLAVLTLAAATLVAAGAATPARSKADRVNVRSRPGYVGEIITQLQRGQPVLVLGTNTLSKPAPDEPAVWVRIELPAEASVWVSADFVDADSKAVTADVLNVRAGPSYDHASVARVKRGTVVKALGEIRDGWIQIAPPTGAVGFVPAAWLDLGATEAAATPADAKAAPVPPASTSVPTQPVPAKKTSPEPGTAAAPPSTPVLNPASTVPVPGSPPAWSSRNDAAWFEQFLVRTNSPAPSQVTSSSLMEGASVSTNATVWATPAATMPVDQAVTNPAPSPVARSADQASPASRRRGLPEGEARWVRREGIVVQPFNISAPSYYGLRARDRRKTVNFLFSTREHPINWREYHGKVVTVTGREYLDERYYWRGVPILDVEEIEAVR